MTAKNVVHITSWLSRQGGGIPPVIEALARTANQRGTAASVVGLDDEWVAADWAAKDYPFASVSILGPKVFGYAPDLEKRILEQLPRRGVVHSHGLWMYPGIAARKCAARRGCPLIVSPHGMLEPWALDNARWKKRFAAWLFESRNLGQAACLHALCAAEAKNFRSYGLKNPIAIIPNGVEVVDEARTPPSADQLLEKFPALKDRRRVLFLSRLHPKKGLLNLLQAWRLLAGDFKDWCLVIAGGGQPAYEQELRSFVNEHQLEAGVVFLGPVFGEAKKQLLAAADVFVLPSFSEGFSMAILEAAEAGVPVLLTRECNFPELVQAGAAMEVRPEAAAIETGLRQILGLSGPQRQNMGQRGLKLVRQSYTWPAITDQMCQVYEWLLGNRPKPDCVSLE